MLREYSALENEKLYHEDIAREILKIVEREFAEDLDLNKLSQKIYLSPYYIGSIFKKHTGITFVQYLNDFRIRRAKEMLRREDIKLTDLAYLVGINNPSYFTELFKQKYGISPGAYKELLKGMQKSV